MDDHIGGIKHGILVQFRVSVMVCFYLEKVQEDVTLFGILQLWRVLLYRSYPVGSWADIGSLLIFHVCLLTIKLSVSHMLV